MKKRDEDAVGHLALDDESVGLFFDLRSQVRGSPPCLPFLRRVAHHITSPLVFARVLGACARLSL